MTTGSDGASLSEEGHQGWIMNLKGVGFAFVGMGCLVVVMAGILALQARDFREHSAVTAGAVKAPHGGQSATEVARVSFRTDDGRQVEFIPAWEFYSQRFEPGQVVRVRYDVDDPANAMIEAFFPLWGMGAVALGLGLLFALVGGGLAVMARAGSRKDGLQQYFD